MNPIKFVCTARKSRHLPLIAALLTLPAPAFADVLGQIIFERPSGQAWDDGGGWTDSAEGEFEVTGNEFLNFYCVGVTEFDGTYMGIPGFTGTIYGPSELFISAGRSDYRTTDSEFKLPSGSYEDFTIQFTGSCDWESGEGASILSSGRQNGRFMMSLGDLIFN